MQKEGQPQETRGRKNERGEGPAFWRLRTVEGAGELELVQTIAWDIGSQGDSIGRCYMWFRLKRAGLNNSVWKRKSD